MSSNRLSEIVYLLENLDKIPEHVPPYKGMIHHPDNFVVWNKNKSRVDKYDLDEIRKRYLSTCSKDRGSIAREYGISRNYLKKLATHTETRNRIRSSKQ